MYYENLNSPSGDQKISASCHKGERTMELKVLKNEAPDINPSAVIHPSAIIHKNVVIGAYAYIGENCHREECPHGQRESHLSACGHWRRPAGSEIRR